MSTWRLRQEDQGFEGNLASIAGLCLKKRKEGMEEERGRREERRKEAKEKVPCPSGNCR